jgi:hypothetical protein
MIRRAFKRITAGLFAGLASGLLAADSTNAPATPAATPESAAPDPAGFVKFIAERNIFNPDRRARSGDSRRPEKPRNLATPTLTLVGTMDYTKGSFAFFDGPAPEYRKTLSAGGTVAGYTLTAILPSSVKLRPAKGAPIELKIGEPLRLDDAPLVETDANAAAGSDTSSTKTDAPPAAEGDAGDILRKLMQKRQQESK